MSKTIINEEVFRANSDKMAIGPTSSYTLAFSVDGTTWSDKQAVVANEQVIVTNIPVGLYFKLKGHNGTVTVID